MKTLVKVVIPFYKANLKDWESAALKQTMNVLGSHPIVFLKPEGLAIDTYTDLYPQAETMSVSADWLGTHRGIAGYNEMMMSKAFYDLFSDTEYILICHTDAWIFHDALNEWCQQGYDLIAAPWPMRPRYNHFPFKQFLQLKKMLCTPSHGTAWIGSRYIPVRLYNDCEHRYVHEFRTVVIASTDLVQQLFFDIKFHYKKHQGWREATGENRHVKVNLRIHVAEISDSPGIIWSQNYSTKGKIEHPICWTSMARVDQFEGKWKITCEGEIIHSVDGFSGTERLDHW